MGQRTGYESGTTYLLRDVPREVWRRARAKALLEGRSMREVIIGLLDEWATFESGGFVEHPQRRTRRRK